LQANTVIEGKLVIQVKVHKRKILTDLISLSRSVLREKQAKNCKILVKKKSHDLLHILIVNCMLSRKKQYTIEKEN